MTVSGAVSMQVPVRAAVGVPWRSALERRVKVTVSPGAAIRTPEVRLSFRVRFRSR